jgi:hypothetical protein
MEVPGRPPTAGDSRTSEHKRAIPKVAKLVSSVVRADGGSAKPNPTDVTRVSVNHAQHGESERLVTARHWYLP